MKVSWTSVPYVNKYLYRDTVVGMATRHGLDGPGLETQCGRKLLDLSRVVPVSTQPPTQWVLLSFPEIKRPERGADQPPPSSAKTEYA